MTLCLNPCVRPICPAIKIIRTFIATCVTAMIGVYNAFGFSGQLLSFTQNYFFIDVPMRDLVHDVKTTFYLQSYCKFQFPAITDIL